MLHVWLIKESDANWGKGVSLGQPIVGMQVKGIWQPWLEGQYKADGCHITDLLDVGTGIQLVPILSHWACYPQSSHNMNLFEAIILMLLCIVTSYLGNI